MLFTSLRTVSTAADGVAGCLQIGLTDEVLRQVIPLVQEPNRELRLAVNALDTEGNSVVVLMDWSARAGGFFCTLSGSDAGYISYDEVVGALGKEHDATSIPVIVKLGGSIPVWRRGVLNPELGTVDVYTKMRFAASCGAEAFILDTESGDLCKCFELECGNPSIEPLRVPVDTLDTLRQQVSEFNPDEYLDEDAFDGLRLFMDELSDTCVPRKSDSASMHFN